MPILDIEGRRVQVDDKFLGMPPGQQNSAVDEIARSLGVHPAGSKELPPGFVLDHGPGGTELPEGFVLDQPPATGSHTAQGNWWDSAPLAAPEQRHTEEWWKDAPLAAQSAPPPPATIGSVAAQVPAGFNSALADVVGGPVDLVNYALHRPVTMGGGQQIASPLGSAPAEPFMGSAWLKDHVLGAIGANPDDRPATNAPERIARAAGGGAAGMMMPVGRIGTAARMAGDLMTGATAGVGGQVGVEAAPDQWKPAAQVVGSLIGGGTGALVTEAGKGVGTLARSAAAYPLATTGAVEREAARQIATRADNPGAVRAALQDGAGTPLVPGSQPTTFQASGDMGLGGLEREVATKAPADFMQRRADQNTARLDAIGRVQPTGAPEEVPKLLRAQLDTIDRTTQADLDQTLATAQARARGIGGLLPPEVSGNAMRIATQAAKDEAKSRERSLWQAVDPDGTLALHTGPIRVAARGIESRLPQAAKPMAGEERAVFDQAGQFGDVMPFSEVTALRSRVSEAMRDELRNAGQTPSYARLAQLRGALEDTIADAVHSKAEQEAQAVARGEMHPDATMASMLQRELQKRDDWLASRGTQQSAVVGSGLAGSGATISTGSGSVPQPLGTAGARRGGFGGAPGNQSLSGQPLAPNFDEAARSRLETATAATRERAQTFGQGPVGQILRTQGMRDNFRVPDAAVPGKFFHSGPTGFQDVQAFRQATDNDGQGLAALHEAAAAGLRRSAVNADGTLDPGRFASWRRSHADSLRAFPDLDARFADAARATEAMDSAAAARREAMNAYQAGAVGKLLKVSDPADVSRTVGTVFNRADAAGEMKRLATEARKSPEALAGLRRAIVDHITDRFVSHTEAATSGQGAIKSDALQSFVNHNAAALREVFDPAELESLNAIAADLKQANRSTTAVKIPGQSNTAQDTLALAQHDGKASLLTKILASGVGAGVGFVKFGPVGSVVGALSGPAIAHMRAAGITKVDELVKQAMLDPKLAETLLSKAPTEQAEHALVGRLRKLAVVQVAGHADIARALMARKQDPLPVSPAVAGVARALMQRQGTGVR